MKKFPIAEPFIIIAIGAAMIIGSAPIVATTSISVGPAFMPRFIGIIFIVLGLGLVPECIKKQKAASALARTEHAEKEHLPLKQKAQKNMHLISWAWVLVYTLLWQPLGFLFASIIYVFGAMFLLTMREEKRNWLVISLVSVLVPLFVYILFRQRFYLMLPMGLCKYIPLRILR